MRLTPAQSHYVLEALLSHRKIRLNQIGAVLKGRTAEIAILRQRLAELEKLDGSDSSRPSRARGARKAQSRRRRRKLSPRLRALRQLQGRYMGFVRQLNTAGKAQVRAAREKQGIEAATRLAASLALAKQKSKGKGKSKKKPIIRFSREGKAKS